MKLNSGAERVLLSWGWLALMALRGAHLGAGKSIQRAALRREQRLNLSLNVKQASSAAPRPSWAESVTRSSGSQAQGASGEGQPQVQTVVGEQSGIQTPRQDSHAPVPGPPLTGDRVMGRGQGTGSRGALPCQSHQPKPPPPSRQHPGPTQTAVS